MVALYIVYETIYEPAALTAVFADVEAAKAFQGGDGTWSESDDGGLALEDDEGRLHLIYEGEPGELSCPPMMLVSTPTPCTQPDSHDAHLALNGECPWCGAYDPDAIDENARLEDFG